MASHEVVHPETSQDAANAAIWNAAAACSLSHNANECLRILTSGDSAKRHLGHFSFVDGTIKYREGKGRQIRQTTIYNESSTEEIAILERTASDLIAGDIKRGDKARIINDLNSVSALRPQGSASFLPNVIIDAVAKSGKHHHGKNQDAAWKKLINLIGDDSVAVDVRNAREIHDKTHNRAADYQLSELGEFRIRNWLGSISGIKDKTSLDIAKGLIPFKGAEAEQRELAGRIERFRKKIDDTDNLPLWTDLESGLSKSTKCLLMRAERNERVAAYVRENSKMKGEDNMDIAFALVPGFGTNKEQARQEIVKYLDHKYPNGLRVDEVALPDWNAALRELPPEVQRAVMSAQASDEAFKLAVDHATKAGGNTSPTIADLPSYYKTHPISLDKYAFGEFIPNEVADPQNFMADLYRKVAGMNAKSSDGAPDLINGLNALVTGLDPKNPEFFHIESGYARSGTQLAQVIRNAGWTLIPLMQDKDYKDLPSGIVVRVSQADQTGNGKVAVFNGEAKKLTGGLQGNLHYDPRYADFVLLPANHPYAKEWRAKSPLPIDDPSRMAGLKESGGKPGFVGRDPNGHGFDFGFFNIYSEAGNPRDYVRWLLDQTDAYDRSIGARLQSRLRSVDAGTEGAFAKEWKKIAEEDRLAHRESFLDSQIRFMRKNYLGPVLSAFPDAIKSGRDEALIVAGAVQWGPYRFMGFIKEALESGADDFNEALQMIRKKHGPKYARRYDDERGLLTWLYGLAES
jgi:hypothetical protein